MNAPTVMLTAYNMGPNVTEADYDLWVAYVAANIDAACRFEVGVSAATYGASQASDLIGDATDEQCETIREALIELWGEWCARGIMIAYVLRDGAGSTEQIEARDIGDARRQAESWVRRGDYGEIASTIWIDVWLNDDRVTVAIDPPEPKCSHSDGHDWQAPHALVGGLKSNPGVWGHDGGVIILSACMRCGCKRTRDTWASRPDTGEQGESVAYEPGAFELSALGGAS